MKLDLWPTDLPSQSLIKTPIAILKGQATLLGNMTKNIVEARVVSPIETLPDRKFYYRFDIVAPCLGDYRYALFTIYHSVDFYPVTFEIGMIVLEDIAENLGCELEDVKVIANTEEEFVEILKTILATNKTRQVVEAILAQSIEGMGTAVSPSDDDSESIDTKEIDEQREATDEELIDESHNKASILPEWGFLARIARIKTMLIRVKSVTDSRIGYFVGVGSNDGMYSVLKPDAGGKNVRVYYKDITSIEFLDDTDRAGALMKKC